MNKLFYLNLLTNRFERTQILSQSENDVEHKYKMYACVNDHFHAAEENK